MYCSVYCVNIATLGPCYNVQVLKIAEDLRQALMEAEDMYLDAGGDRKSVV